ncbi:acyl-coenzyme A thioesterase PaaI-like protein [Lipingzhangella halophila]|uniref:Acyl-coenzyme A thioesterase THEM4 n=1 Tax=Lipingzhangella halophila TaxID=1783352 RepID=A0A7W7W1H4_9ACTN|nr:PaaI family thioesterase [Lipingzhangella halophila]MBB4930972.1 acyl-coenzyme A thioesterase PaaI-like protein [Lipingzhangella halophila]
MSVDAAPVSELPDPRDFGLPVVTEDDLPDELGTLVARVHDLVDAVAHTEAGSAELAQASATVHELTERLNVKRRDIGAMLERPRSDGGADYETLTNVVSGRSNPAAPPLVLEHTDDGVRARVTLNGTYQGPPGLAHGGWVAAMLDQVLGSASAAAGMVGLTANLDVNYRNPTPLNAPLELTARVTGTERRKVFVSAEIRHNGEVTAEGTAVMVRLDVPG